jgi:hypothetical protein
VVIGAIAAWTPRLLAWRISSRSGAALHTDGSSGQTALWSTMIAANVLTILLAAVVLIFAPGAVHPLLLPAVAGSVALLFIRRRTRLPDAAAAAATLLAIAAWAPLEAMFHDAFGTALGIFSCVRGALVALPATVLILPMSSCSLGAR